MPSTITEVAEFPVEQEFYKNPDIRREDIAKLRDWLRTQPHLPADLITDLDLIITYHCCQKSAEVTKQVLDLHYSLRTLCTTFFKDRKFDETVEHSLKTILYAPLPKPTPEGYRAVYVRLLDADPKNFFFTDVVKTFMIMFDLWQREEGTWPGFILMVDLDKSVIGHLARVDVMSIRQVLYFFQEVMLVRLKGVHFLSAPYFMDKVMLLLKPFIKKELMDILHIHQVNSDTVYKFVPKECFPKENGGDYNTSYNDIKDNLTERLRNNQNFIREENKKRVDENCRPDGKKTTVETVFGIEGSFKKLDID